MIEVQSLSVRIGKRLVLRDVDFVAPAGMVTAVVGPNGSGKSTLVKALSGDLRHEGTAQIHGRDLSKLTSVEQAGLRAVLPQASALPFPFLAREVVMLGLTSGRSGLLGADLQDLPELALERFDLAAFGGRFYGELSGGEQQRVQLARVLAQVWLPVLDGVPRYLFLDEPVSSLDIKHQLLVMQVARDFADAGGGVIAVLHDLNLAAMFADRMLALSDGQAARFGTPDQVLTDDMLATMFDCSVRVGVTPRAGTPFILPQSANSASASASVSRVAS